MYQGGKHHGHMGSNIIKAKCPNFLVFKFALQRNFFLIFWREQQNLDGIEFICQGKKDGVSLWIWFFFWMLYRNELKEKNERYRETSSKKCNCSLLLRVIHFKQSTEVTTHY